MKTYFIFLMTLIVVNISFSQNLVSESDIKIQYFGKETYYKDLNNLPLNGYYKIADRRGNYSDVIFKNGKKDGKSTNYDYEGRVVKITYYEEGKSIGTYTTYHKNGKTRTVGVFTNGEQDGKWETFNNKGKTSDIEYYKEGKKTGKWKTFDKKGELIRIENYKNDKKNGKWWSRNYYPQYQKYTYEIEHFKDGKHVGHAEEKNEDGALLWERDYKSSYTYTHKQYYHENGQLAEIYHIKESKYNKENIKYNLDGSIQRQQLFKEGVILKSAKEYEDANKRAAIKVDRGTTTKVASAVEKTINDFSYKALIISNAKYVNTDIGQLDFPTEDAEKLVEVLKDRYTFKENDIVHIKDATRFDIINTMDSLAKKITSNDNLLIFYAGHGVYDETLNKGYWIPVDASLKKDNWVSNSDIRDYISAFKSQHTLLISDACFSGSIFEYKQRHLNPRGKAITEKLLRKKSRKAMTSGLNKTVPDKSVFVKYLIETLKYNKKPFLRAGELYNDIREAVIANTDNNPQFEVIKNTDHEGGEFIFLRKN